MLAPLVRLLLDTRLDMYGRVWGSEYVFSFPSAALLC